MLQPLGARLSFKAARLCFPSIARAALLSSEQAVCQTRPLLASVSLSSLKGTVFPSRSFTPLSTSGPGVLSIPSRIVNYPGIEWNRGCLRSMSSSAALSSSSFESFPEGGKIKEILVFWFGEWADPSKVRPRQTLIPRSSEEAALRQATQHCATTLYNACICTVFCNADFGGPTSLS